MRHRRWIAPLLLAIACLGGASGLASEPLNDYRADTDLTITVSAEGDGKRWLADDVDVVIRSRMQPRYQLKRVTDGEGRVHFRVPARLAPFDVWAALHGCNPREIPILSLETLHSPRELELILDPLVRVILEDDNTGLPMPGTFPVRVQGDGGEWTLTPDRSGLALLGCFEIGELVRARTLAPPIFELSAALIIVNQPIETVRLRMREVPPIIVLPLAQAD